MLFPFICVSLSQLELMFCTIEVGSVLTYYCCIMTCHTANCLKQSSLTISQFLYVKSADVAQLSYLLRIPLGDFKMLVQLCYHLKLSIFSKLTGCWQNSFPAGCVTEVQVFLLVVGQELLSARLFISAAGECLLLFPVSFRNHLNRLCPLEVICLRMNSKLVDWGHLLHIHKPFCQMV